jgi:fermentation-respiration switch protein FrsA (DUF1100 family)
MASPFTAWLWPDAFNNLDAIQSLDIPVLFIHSSADQVVSYTHSETLLEATGELGELHLVDGYGHNAIYQEVGDTYFTPILEFIEE